MSKNLVLALLATFGTAWSASASEDPWAPYLDYAFVYVSAEPETLSARLSEYASETGIPLADYVRRAMTSPQEGEPIAEATLRRTAIAQLLLYLSSGEATYLEQSVETLKGLHAQLGRQENRYWNHYILAHQALEKGRHFDFVGELMELWLKVVTPLESPFETLQTLSLSDSPNAGFVSALPYVYENISRLILIRSQEMGIDRDLDPLAAIVRLLGDGRVGAHPEVIPPAATSRAYVDRIVERLNGPESDGGSLTFTLALFEASKYHDEARSLLAQDGLGPETLKAIGIASGAYENALRRATTEQGRCAVYTRVLRQIGEVYAAKQRLGVDPEVPSPFTIESAIEVYTTLHKGGEKDDGWKDLGYATTGRDSYIEAMHTLWEEIQEATLNAADYYLARGLADPVRGEEHSRGAARLYARYLAFFETFTTNEGNEAVPESAYFAAYEAAKGHADALLDFNRYTPHSMVIQRAVRYYLSAMKIFPFDRQLWPSLTRALALEGRESDYLGLVTPIAERVTKSRNLNTWIEKNETGAAQIENLRRALSDSQVIMHLGFAEAAGIDELERGLAELRARRGGVAQQIGSASGAEMDSLPAAPDPDAFGNNAGREQEDTAALLARLDRQISAQSRVLPLYRATLEVDDLAFELRSQRNHPVHTLLRRIFHENQS